ncbi:MAG: hypothetical protein E6G10_12610 [Actinobacteria bacterium]|nr:MAG: hypothetical protein E6G10_12610 [Actinomycetota bacterium]
MATELAPGVWMWRREHPEWGPGADYEPEVSCYAVELPSARLLIDPLWPEEDADVDWLDALVRRRRVIVAVLKPDHLREGAELAHAYGGRVVTNAAVASLLHPTVPFSVLEPGEPLADGARLFEDGRGRGETPLWLPTHGAIAFADAVRGDPAGGLRVWSYPPGREEATRAALEVIAALEPDLVLVGHGDPVVSDGAAALREALRRPPWVEEEAD